MSKTRSKRFQGWDKVTIVNDHGIEKEAVAPVIISASWKTDISAWHNVNKWVVSASCRSRPFLFIKPFKLKTEFFVPLCREQTNTKAIMIAVKFIQKGD